MATPNISDHDLIALKTELHELRKLKNNVESRSEKTSKIKMFLMKLWAGPELSKSLENWMEARESGDTDNSISSTANLLAAVLRRVMRVSFVFIFFASVPIILIIWQNIIMERQNQSLISQIEAQRTASSNQQVTGYLRQLLSGDETDVLAAEGFLVSDLVNRNLAIERLAALMNSGNSKVQCPALSALSRIVESSTNLTLRDVLSGDGDEDVIISDLRCLNTDFSGVDFGAITFLDSGFPGSSFTFSDLTEVEFQTSNLRHSDFTSDFTDARLCEDNTLCVRFLEDTDLSHSKLTFTNRNKDVFKGDLILKGAQMTFGPELIDAPEKKTIFGRAKQIKTTRLIIPKIQNDNLISRGVCYEASFSQCFLYHQAKDSGKLKDEKLNSLRQYNCPVNLDGPIILSSIASCDKLGLQPR